MRSPVRLALWVLLFAAGAWLGSLARTRTGLHASYYANLTRSGPPIAETIDREPSTETLRTGPARGWSHFSVEWTGMILLPRDGTYSFATISDDGSELEIDGSVVVRNGGVHGPQEQVGTMDLRAGMHAFRLRYEQAGGGLALHLRYAPPGEPPRTLPAAALLPEAMSLAEYRFRQMLPLLSGAALVALWVVLPRRPPREARRSTRVLDRHGLAVVVASGVAVRVLMLMASDAILWPDSDVFLYTVDAVLAGRYLEHDAFRTLLYPYFLAGFLYWGTSPFIGTLTVIGQQALGLAATVAVFVIGRRLFGAGPALAAAVLLNLHTIELFYELSILSETLFVFVLSLALLAIHRSLTRPSMTAAVIVGAMCALLTLTRPVAQWYVIVPIGAMLLLRASTKERLAWALATLAVYAALMTPWLVVNQRHYGFYGVAIGRGLGLFIRAFEVDRMPEPTITAYPDVHRALVFARATGRAPGNFVHSDLKAWGYSTYRADEAMYRYALEAIGERPANFAATTVRQWLIQLGANLGGARICRSSSGDFLCSGRTIGYVRAPFANAPRPRWRKVREVVVGFVRHGYVRMPVVLGLALFGMVVYAASSRAEWRMALVMALTIAYYTFVAGATQFPQDRYRLPVDGLLFLFAAVGASALVHAAPFVARSDRVLD